FSYRAANKFFGGAGNVPGKVEFLGEDVRGSAGKKSERHAVSVLVRCKAVDDFIQSTVAPASDYEAATFRGGAVRDFCGVARAGGLRKFGTGAAGDKNRASRIECAAAAFAAATGVGIMNQQSVLEVRGH